MKNNCSHNYSCILFMNLFLSSDIGKKCLPPIDNRLPPTPIMNGIELKRILLSLYASIAAKVNLVKNSLYCQIFFLHLVSQTQLTEDMQLNQVSCVE